MRVFLDSSALVKRYIKEKGSDKVQEFFKEGNDVFVSIICLPEMISAASRKMREKKLRKEQFQMIKKAVMAEYTKFHVVVIQPAVLMRSVELLERYPLRTLDSLHLACAIEIDPDLFVSSDDRQVQSGKKAGLKVRLIS